VHARIKQLMQAVPGTEGQDYDNMTRSHAEVMLGSLAYIRER
jgi:hypothetical protein